MQITTPRKTKSQTLALLCILLLLSVLHGCSDLFSGSTDPDDYIPVGRITEMRDAFYARDYPKLERFVSEHQARAERDPVAENLLYDIENIFSFTFARDQEIYDAWLSAHPQSWVAHLARGIYQRKLGWEARGPGYANEVDDRRFEQMETHFDKARDDLRDALRLKPTLTLAYAGLINMAMASSLRAEKQAILQEALSHVPTTYLVRDIYLVSLLPQWGGSWAEVDSFTERAYALRDQNPLFARLRGFANYHRAMKYRRAEQYEKAIAELNAAIEYDPFWNFYYERGYNRMQMGDYALALEDLDVAIAKREGIEKSLNRRADILMELGKYDQALEDINRAFELYPRSLDVLSRRANLHWHMKRYGQANQDYSAMLERNPKNAWALDMRGSLNLKHLHNYELASKDLLAAYLIEPKPSTWFNYATALYSLKDDKTVMAFEMFLEICKQETCHSSDRFWATNFVKCVSGDASCTWRTEFYAYFVKKDRGDTQ